MKKQSILFLCLTLSTILSAQVSKTVDCTAGTLSSLLTASEKSTVTDLTLTGTIDARDFMTMRDNMPALAKIDIGTVTIAVYQNNLANQIPAGAFCDTIKWNSAIYLKSIVMPTNITSIGRNAFFNCTGLTGNLTIPNLITSIGNRAFMYCAGFTGSLTIPNSVTSIGDNAFDGCHGFTGNLIIPNSVISIGDGAFLNCYGFTGNLIFSNSVISIGNQAFYGCNGFKGNLTIPNSVTSIGDGAFAYCVGFTGDLDIPNSVVSIGDRVFEDCSALIVRSISNSVTKIGIDTFSGCQFPKIVKSIAGSLSSILSPIERFNISSLTITGSIDARDFKFMRDSMPSLTALDMGDVIISAYQNNLANQIPDGAFYDTLQWWVNSKLKSINMPSSTTSIGRNAFFGCEHLMGKLTIPNSVTTIGNLAFYYCSGLTGNLIIPNSVTSIGDGAFSNCSGFTGDLIIPNSVVSIGDESFNNCSALDGILTIVNTETNIGCMAFGNCKALRIQNLPKNLPPNCLSAISGCIYEKKVKNSAGGISSKLSSDEKVNVSSLVITGTIDFRDFKFMRDSMPTLTSIDMGEATISSFQSYEANQIPEEALSSTKFTSIAMPSSTTNIGSKAFYNCYNLIGYLTIPPSVTSIGNKAFYGCSRLIGNLTIPNSVNSIGEEAFAFCSGLDGDLTISSSLTIINNNTFYGCRLNVRSIPNSITSIGNNAFSNCKFIKSVNCTAGLLSTTLTKFEKERIENLSIAGSIDARDFKFIRDSLPYLTDIDMGSTTIAGYQNNLANQIPAGAFCDTIKFRSVNCLKSIVMPSSTKSIGRKAFYYCFILSGDSLIPNSVTTIGDYAFYCCSGFTGNLIIPNSVTHIGDYAFCYCSGKANLTLSDSLISIGDDAFYGSNFTGNLNIPNSVTSIGCGAFGQCTGLNVQYMPNTVKFICSSAFGGSNFCKTVYNEAGSLSTILKTYEKNDISTLNILGTIDARDFKFLRDSMYSLTALNISQATIVAYENNLDNEIPSKAFFLTNKISTLRYIAMPNNLTSIGDYAFVNCTGLINSLAIPNNVTKIGNFAFSGCKNITKFIISSSVTNIGSSAFKDCTGVWGDFFIPMSVNDIGLSIFEGCIGLSSISVDINNTNFTSEDGILYNKDKTILYSCPIRKYGNLNIPTSVKIINKSAFYNCSYLTCDLILPTSIEFIGDNAFNGCTGMTGNLIIPNKVTYIGDSTFKNCNYIRGLNLSKSITSIGNSAFYNCRCLLGDLNIPKAVKRIGSCAFAFCGFDGNISLGDSLINIGDQAFYNCRGLNGDLVIPNSLTDIGNYAFEGCYNINGKLTIPNSVKSICREAFAVFNSLTSIKAESKTPVDLTNSSNVFSGVNKTTCTLYVPKGSKTAYQSAVQWKDFLNIVEYDDIATECDDVSFASKFYLADGQLHIKNAPAGEQVSITAMSGMIVYTGVITTDELSVALPQHGVYIVTVGSSSQKVAY
jgi:BspA type Leucine rich repeat region (6 copies)/Domain of unknown function (DUF6383)